MWKALELCRGMAKLCALIVLAAVLEMAHAGFPPGLLAIFGAVALMLALAGDGEPE